MAIAGLLVHALPEAVQELEEKIGCMEEMTTYGVHEEQYVVVVVEAETDHMEMTVEKIKDLDGVLTVYTTYLTVEDELAEDPDKVFAAPKGKNRKK